MRHWIQQVSGEISIFESVLHNFYMFLNLLTENFVYTICLVSSAAGDVISLHFTVMLTSVTNS
jgi:hypothetical protein